jgi:diadenosine tetraphosphate (Ap4A) HIT family hydrolase
VLLPLRHVEGLQELTLDEAAALGPLLRRLSAALAEVTGCHKAYVIFLAEQPSFEHVHFHVVPRLPSFSKEKSGAGVFAFMRRPEAEQVSERGRDAMALGIRRALASA